MSYYSNFGFFSYTHGAGADAWYGTSKNKIEQYFQNAFGERDRQIFFDRQCIDAGTNWQVELREGLDRSPILIPIFSPAYFNSDFCVAELKTFMRREDKLGLQRGALIHAAKVYDHRLFPAWAQQIQAVALDDFFLLDDSFWNSPKSHDFDLVLKGFADAATQKIRKIGLNGPHYNEDFPKLPDVPEPTEPNAELVALFGPQGPVPQPFSEGVPA
ncbi:MAG: toll/interleukin-1 receptor domain-containing protein [Aliishimia sp.]